MQDQKSYDHSFNMARLTGISDGTMGGYTGRLHHESERRPTPRPRGPAGVQSPPGWPTRVWRRIPLVVHLLLGALLAALAYSNSAQIGLGDRPALAAGLGFGVGLFGVALVLFAFQLVVVGAFFYLAYVVISALRASQ
jgi:hypothetical protein